MLNFVWSIELCLTSNVKCKTVPSFSEHQFAYLYEAKHPICIAVSNLFSFFFPLFFFTYFFFLVKYVCEWL